MARGRGLWLRSPRLRKRKMQEWQDALRNLRDPLLRMCVYRIVWWDYLADLRENQMEGTGVLYQGAVPRANVVTGLVQVGYRKRDARRRMRPDRGARQRLEPDRQAGSGG